VPNPPKRRSSKRVQIPKRKTVKINQKDCVLINISHEGIGVLVTGSQTFFIGQRIDDILLEPEAESTSLKGIVSHLTENETGKICGIRFEFQNGGDFDYVQKINNDMGTS
jgi:hypothetical protein